MSTIGVCIPVFEGAAFLDGTLAAIRAQSHADLRILISVDPSRDASLALCRRWAARDDRIAVFAQERRLGFVGNLNFLVRRVETPFFCFTPQDDRLAPDYLASLLAPMREPSVALAYADLVRGDAPRAEFQASLRGNRTERILGYLARQVNFVEWRGLVRTACVDAAFPFVAGENVDQAMPLKLARHGELVRVPRPLYRKAVHARSATAHQRESEAGRLQRLADAFESCFSCHRLAAAALPDAELRAWARIALLLRCLNVAAAEWTLERPEPAPGAESEAFGAIVRHRARDALAAHRALATPSDAGRRHPRILAMLRATALFHLALAARHLGRRGDAAVLMRRAVGLDPELPGLDGLRRAMCKQVLGRVPGTVDPPRAAPV